MSEAKHTLRFRRHVELPYRAEPAGAAPAPLRALLDCGSDAQTRLWRLDWAALAADERAWLEGGEALPALTFAWLERAAALMRLCAQHGWPAAVLELPSKGLVQLSIDDVTHAVASSAWYADAQVALVWGMAHEALTHPQRVRWPLPCRGAVYPLADGLDVGWWAAASDVAHIGG
jgi:hypothetical protein